MIKGWKGRGKNSEEVGMDVGKRESERSLEKRKAWIQERKEEDTSRRERKRGRMRAKDRV